MEEYKEGVLNGLAEKQREDFNAYKNYVRALNNPAYKSEIYSVLKNVLSDIPFLKLQLGVYYNNYIEEICKKMHEFEIITFKYFETKNIEGIHREVILNLKLEVEELLLRVTNSKNIRNFKGKRGRKSAELKEAKEYLWGFVNEKHKLNFVNELKKEYQESEHYVFNHVIKILNDIGKLKFSNRRVIRISFEKALNRESQSQANFDKQFSKNLKDSEEYKSIRKNIIKLIESSLTS